MSDQCDEPALAAVERLDSCVWYHMRMFWFDLTFFFIYLFFYSPMQLPCHLCCFCLRSGSTTFPLSLCLLFPWSAWQKSKIALGLLVLHKSDSAVSLQGWHVMSRFLLCKIDFLDSFFPPWISPDCLCVGGGVSGMQRLTWYFECRAVKIIKNTNR